MDATADQFGAGFSAQHLHRRLVYVDHVFVGMNHDRLKGEFHQPPVLLPALQQYQFRLAPFLDLCLQAGGLLCNADSKVPV